MLLIWMDFMTIEYNEIVNISAVLKHLKFI